VFSERGGGKIEYKEKKNKKWERKCKAEKTRRQTTEKKGRKVGSF
jgi:hypothetical protein